MINAFNLLGSGGYLGGGALNPNFATTLYTGNGGTQNIVTGKNNAAGSLTWLKKRSGGSAESHYLFDTVRGAGNHIQSNKASAQSSSVSLLTVFNSNGFTLGSSGSLNESGGDFVAWTFLKAAGFMDIVSYTGNGGLNTILHTLGVEVGSILIKCTSAILDWYVHHRSIAGNLMKLNSTSPATGGGGVTATTTTDFSLNGLSTANDVGQQFIAYLFAHNPSGGIACDSFTTDGSGNATVNVGFKPQWLLVKRTTGVDNWAIIDTKRGWAGGSDPWLGANLDNAEQTNVEYGAPTSSGFNFSGVVSAPYIYIAIR